ncbi:Cationic amino acid transporter, C-terminal [Sesbania bispinosa]|nr:Cationic amino acid transporter, C-terminal [Sesbania bispinosa]
MNRCLTWWDLIWLAFGSVVGSGIFVVTGQEPASVLAPPSFSPTLPPASPHFSPPSATPSSPSKSPSPAAPSPSSASSSAISSPSSPPAILLEALVGAAGLGRSWSSYFATMVKNDPDFFRIRVKSFKPGFNMLDPLAVAVLLIANGIAVSGTRNTSILTWLSSIVTVLVIAFIIVVGFIHGKASNLVPFFPFGAKGVFQAAAVVYWSYTGFDMVATMAEETKNPSRDIPIGLVGSMSMITVIYCLMALALVTMVNYTQIDVDAAYSVAFVQIGMNWGKYLVSVCALKGMTTSLLVGSMGQARYTTQIARSHMIPPFFALVHPKTGTPVNATLLTTLSSCVVALFSSLDVLSSVFSVSTLFIFMLMAVALLVRRYYVREGISSKSDLRRLLLCLFVIIGSSAVGAGLWSSDALGWIGYTVAACVWFLATFGMSFLQKQRAPKVWGVPLVPWLPSLSIATNLFLMGSLGAEAFWRFLICSAVMLVYYLFVGVHATYDVDHQIAVIKNQNLMREWKIPIKGSHSMFPSLICRYWIDSFRLLCYSTREVKHWDYFCFKKWISLALPGVE